MGGMGKKAIGKRHKAQEEEEGRNGRPRQAKRREFFLAGWGKESGVRRRMEEGKR